MARQDHEGHQTDDPLTPAGLAADVIVSFCERGGYHLRGNPWLEERNR